MHRKEHSGVVEDVGMIRYPGITWHEVSGHDHRVDLFGCVASDWTEAAMSTAS
jgi:hypothetical protein